MFALSLFAGLFLSLRLAWADDDQQHCGPVLVGQTFLAASTNATDGSTPWALTSHGVAEKLFTVGQEGEILGQVAKSVAKESEFVWTVTLKSDYWFSDGSPVDASTVATCLMEQNKINSNAQSSLGSMTVTVESPTMVKIASERGTHVMDAVLAEWAFVVYKRDADGNFVFTGPYMIETFTPQEIDLIPNPFYPGAFERPAEIKLKKYGDGHALADAVEAGEVDLGFHLPIDRLPELRKVEGISIKSFEVGYHYMVFYNMDTLQDLRVRRAIDLAIDRTALSQALAGGKGTRSLFPDNSPFFSDGSDPHGDPNAAAAALDEAGWTLNAFGKREKDGVELSITLVAYPHRIGLVIVQPVIADSLRTLGITVDTIVTGDDWSDTQKIIDDRSFDMLMWAQHTLPAGDPAWFLSSFFRSEGGNNHANLNSATVDSHIDTLSLAEGHANRVLLTQVAQEAILQQVPVSNLVTPDWHVAVDDRLIDYEPWGSDYYVIRADFRAKKSNDCPGSSSRGVNLVVSFIIVSVLSTFLVQGTH